MNDLNARPNSRAKVLKGWASLIGVLALFAVFWLWTDGRKPSPGLVHEQPENVFGIIGRITIGMIAVGFGAAAYTVVILTRCFTFDFHKPVWPGFKTRLYFANIIVPVIFMVAGGILLSAFLIPLLQAHGFSKNMASTIPIVLSVVILQIGSVWINIWTPLAQPLHRLRLKAKGITDDQLARGTCVGISDPTRKTAHKWTFVEEDIGMLWLDDERLTYFGDTTHFSVLPNDILEFTCELDAGSSTVLGGIAHPILRIRQVDGTDRRVRFHVEDAWSMTARRIAHNRLAAAIQNWLAKAQQVPLQQAA